VVRAVPKGLTGFAAWRYREVMALVGGDGDTTCVVCGAPLDRWPNNHKCAEKRLAQIERAQKSHGELKGNREPSLRERLAMGEFLNRLSEGE
jgi:hypothetical protein